MVDVAVVENTPRTIQPLGVSKPARYRVQVRVRDPDVGAVECDARAITAANAESAQDRAIVACQFCHWAAHHPDAGAGEYYAGRNTPDAELTCGIPF